jgi:hypothetical protein
MTIKDNGESENPAAAWEMEAMRSYQSIGLFDATPTPVTIDWEMELAFRQIAPGKQVDRKPTEG